MNPNPLSDREKALEGQWIKEKEWVLERSLSVHLKLTSRRMQLAKDRAAKKQQSAKDAGLGSGSKEQPSQTGQEKK